MISTESWRRPLLGRQIQWEHPLAKGLVGCYRLNEGSGTLANDLTNIRGPGTFGNTPHWGPGGVDFTGGGSNDHIALDGNFGFGVLGRPWTIAVRAMQRSSSDDHQVWGRFADGVLFQLDVQGTDLFVGYGSGGTFRFIDADGTIALNQWHTLVLTYDASNDGRLYVDGVLVATQTTDPPAFNHATDNMHIGNRSDGTEDFDGIVDYLYAYNWCLTLHEIGWLGRDPDAIFREMPIFVPAVGVGRPLPQRALYGPFVGPTRGPL